jgi:hypothetical protein
MDKVSAGFDFLEVDINNAGATVVGVNIPDVSSDVCSGSACFLAIKGTPYPSGVQSFQLYAAFGPGFGM